MGASLGLFAGREWRVLFQTISAEASHNDAQVRRCAETAATIFMTAELSTGAVLGLLQIADAARQDT